MADKETVTVADVQAALLTRLKKQAEGGSADGVLAIAHAYALVSGSVKPGSAYENPELMGV